MYATLSLQSLIKALGILSIAVFIFVILITGMPDENNSIFRKVSYSTTATLLLLAVSGSSSSYWSPWRIIWRIFPILNKMVWPDVNGSWQGKTSSNWPKIKKMNDFARANEKIDDEIIDQIELQHDDIQILVKASFFSIRIQAKLSSTGSVSNSLTARVLKNPASDEYELFYIYEQATPEPERTDENKHFGAASLAIIPGAKMKLAGMYWTRRNWHRGLNTAGKLLLERTSAKIEN